MPRIAAVLSLTLLASCTPKERRESSPAPTEPSSAAAANPPATEPTTDALAAQANLSGPCPAGKLTIDGAPAAILGASAVTIVDGSQREFAAQLLVWHEGGRALTCADVGKDGWPSGPRYVRISRAVDGPGNDARTWVGGVGTKRADATITIEQRDARALTLCVRSPVEVESEWDGRKHRVVVVGSFTGDNCGSRQW